MQKATFKISILKICLSPKPDYPLNMPLRHNRKENEMACLDEPGKAQTESIIVVSDSPASVWKIVVQHDSSVVLAEQKEYMLY